MIYDLRDLPLNFGETYKTMYDMKRLPIASIGQKEKKRKNIRVEDVRLICKASKETPACDLTRLLAGRYTLDYKYRMLVPDSDVFACVNVCPLAFNGKCFARFSAWVYNGILV